MNVPSKPMHRLAGVALLALVLTLGLSPSAFAQESSRATYGGPSPQVFSGGGSGGAAGGPSASADAADDGSLPFTGLDLGLAAGGGILLLGAGVAMAAATSRRPHPDQA